jgi:hypothetical protein
MTLSLSPPHHRYLEEREGMDLGQEEEPLDLGSCNAALPCVARGLGVLFSDTLESEMQPGRAGGGRRPHLSVLPLDGTLSIIFHRFYFYLEKLSLFTGLKNTNRAMT